MLGCRQPRDASVGGVGEFLNHGLIKSPSGRAHPPYAGGVRPFVCILEARLHFGDVHDLKGKRKQLKSLKDGIRRRFGASVAETEGHDTWQRSTLVCALVGDSAVGDRADELERFIESRCPDGCAFSRDLLSLEDIRG
ncbi:MAG: DUF503 domain-containing protein [Solirubrobacterales bacterium]